MIGEEELAMVNNTPTAISKRECDFLVQEETGLLIENVTYKIKRLVYSRIGSSVEFMFMFDLTHPYAELKVFKLKTVHFMRGERRVGSGFQLKVSASKGVLNGPIGGGVFKMKDASTVELINRAIEELAEDV